MKRGKHPTNSRRKSRQRLKERLAKVMHDAQLAGIIPIQPEGVLRNERVDPLTQDAPTDHLSLAAVAARNNWATPDGIKPLVVDNLAKIATGGGGETLVGRDGEVINTGPSLKTQVYAAKVLTEIDQIQYERNNPAEAGKAKGGVHVVVPVGVQVENNTNMTVFGSIDDLLRRAREQREGRVVSDGDAIVVEAERGSQVEAGRESSDGGAIEEREV